MESAESYCILHREKEREKRFRSDFPAKLAQASAVDNVGIREEKKKRLPPKAITVRTASDRANDDCASLSASCI